MKLDSGMPPVSVFDRYAAKYDAWFDEHPAAFASELAAVRSLMPDEGTGVEIGAGTGRFGAALGVSLGVEPAAAMREMAARRGLRVLDGTAEALPLDDASYDCAIMITVDCYIGDLTRAYGEVHRVLKPGGIVLIGMLDRSSPPGRHFEAEAAAGRFFREAQFRSVDDVVQYLEAAGFDSFVYRQTLFGGAEGLKRPDEVRQGHGEGLFVVIRGIKRDRTG